MAEEQNGSKDEVLQHRLGLVDEIIALLVKTVGFQRKNTLAVGLHPTPLAPEVRDS